MPFLIGMLIGREFTRMVFSRLVGLLAIWLAIPLFANWLATAWIAAGAGVVASFAATGMAFAWAMVRPAASPIKLRMLEGVLVWCRILILIAAARTLFRLIFGGPSLAVFASEARWIAIGAMAYVVSRWVMYWVRRDARACA